MTKAKRVALVAGATRGAGRGIARALGEAGYFVYCTGRSTRDHPSPYKRAETLEETVELIESAGGQAVAVRVDHTIEREVVELFERIERERGGVDVVVDSVAGEDPLLGGWTGMLKTDLTNAEAAFRQSLVSHLYTSRQAALALQKRKRGLLVEVTEYDLLFGGGYNLISAIVKSSLKSLALLLADELRKERVTVVSMTPGFMRSESVLEHFGVTEENWREGGKQDPHFLASETPRFIGRAVVALANDPKMHEKTGHILSSWDVAREYGVDDVDGRRPDWGTHWRDAVVTTMPALRAGIERQVAWLEAIAARGREQLAAKKSAKSPKIVTKRAAQAKKRRASSAKKRASGRSRPARRRTQPA